MRTKGKRKTVAARIERERKRKKKGLFLSQSDRDSGKGGTDIEGHYVLGLSPGLFFKTFIRLFLIVWFFM